MSPAKEEAKKLIESAVAEYQVCETLADTRNLLINSGVLSQQFLPFLLAR